MVDIHTDENTIRFGFGDGAEPFVVSWRWVRDHSRDDTSFDPRTSQREVDTFALGANHPSGTASVDGDNIRVVWPDDTTDSILPISMLRAVSGRSAGIERTLWRDQRDVAMAKISYAEVTGSDTGLSAWLADISRYGVGLVTNAPPEMGSVEALTKRIGYVRHTIFGGTWTLQAGLSEHADSAYGTSTLEPHTDGTYSHDAPGLQLFVCAERTGDGGESVVVDGFAAAQHLRDNDPAAFETLSTTSVPAHYIEDGVHLVAKRPTIRLDESGNLRQVTFNNYDRAPFALAPDEMEEWYRAYGAFHALVSDPSSWFTKYLTPGDALIIDNWRCLHGRLAFTGTRVFHGAYLNHEDLESSLRITEGSSNQ